MRFQLRTVLAAQLGVAVLLSIYLSFGFSAIYILLLSICCMLLRRVLASQVSGRVGCFSSPIPPIVPRCIARDRNERGLLAHLCWCLRQPISISWMWGLWIGWQLSWVSCRADAPIEKDYCFTLAVIPVWVLCTVVLARDRFRFTRRGQPLMRAVADACTLSLAEFALLFAIATLLGVHIHFVAGGSS